MPADHIRGSRYMCPMGAGFISVVLYSVDVTLVLGDHMAAAARAPLPCGLPNCCWACIFLSRFFYASSRAKLGGAFVLHAFLYFPRVWPNENYFPV